MEKNTSNTQVFQHVLVGRQLSVLAVVGYLRRRRLRRKQYMLCVHLM